MRLIGLAGLAGACLATTPVFAADLFGSAPPPMDAPPIQQELGSNWYIRGDVGYGQVQQATVVPQAGLLPPQQIAGFTDPLTQVYTPTGWTFNDRPIGNPTYPVQITRGNDQTVNSPVFGFGVGYRVNDWFRVEANYSFVHGPGLGVSSKVTCPEVATAVSNYYNISAANPTGTQTPVGYQWDANTCTGNLNLSQYNNQALASVYADLGHWWMGITPYIGAGVGLNVNTVTGTLAYKTDSNGASYAGPTVSGSAPALWVVDSGRTDAAGHPIYSYLTSPNGNVPDIPIGPQNWDRKISQTKYTIAGQLAAGFGMPISQSATLDLGYRATTTDVFGGVKGLMQTVNLGVRYNLN